MQKIRCPRCGVVNLEKFLTYPQCAGCGGTLPVPKTSAAPFWKRPLGVLWWIPLIGGAIIGLVVAASFLTVPVEDNARILIYGNASRRVVVNQTVVVTMTLDAVAETRAQRRAPLQNVKLRLPRSLFKNFAFVSLDPQPDEVLMTSGGRYLQYRELPREAALRLRLYALHPGRYRVQTDFYADEHAPGEFAFTVVVAPAKSRTKP